MFSLLGLAAQALPAGAAAESKAPWGQASAKDIDYSKQKVVFDVAVASKNRMNAVLDRASFIRQLNGANPFSTKVVLVCTATRSPTSRWRTSRSRGQVLLVAGRRGPVRKGLL